MNAPVRRETWKQANHFAQLVTLLSAIDGNLSNFQCSIIDRKTFSDRYKDLSEQMMELAPFIEKGSW